VGADWLHRSLLQAAAELQRSVLQTQRTSSVQLASALIFPQKRKRLSRPEQKDTFKNAEWGLI
jgi:hypothetical protein